MFAEVIYNLQQTVLSLKHIFKLKAEKSSWIYEIRNAETINKFIYCAKAANRNDRERRNVAGIWNKAEVGRIGEL